MAYTMRIRTKRRGTILFFPVLRGCVISLLLTAVPLSAQRTLVDIIVAQNVKSELQPKLDRLADDMGNDGFTTRMTSWPAGTRARDVWNHLKDAYDNDNLQGALLVGQIPIPAISGISTDMPYWNMSSFQTTGRVRTWNVWVSRFNALGECSEYGDEVTLLTNALDANHFYRTGKSRLPHTAWISVYDNFSTITGGMTLARQWAEAAEDTWKEAIPVPEILEPIFEKGGDIINFKYHGLEHSVIGHYTMDDVFEKGFLVRVALHMACHNGVPGGIANSQTLVEGGANVISVGATTVTPVKPYVCALMSSYGNGCRRLLRNGSAWGPAMVESFPFPEERGLNTRVSCLMMYGDLSLKSNALGHQVAPENHIPTVVLKRPSPGRPMVGEPTVFSAEVNDPDGDPMEVSWFLEGGGDTPDQVTKNVSSGTVTVPWSYTKTGAARPYVVVKDPWMARGASEKLELKVGDPEKANLKLIVSALNPDLMLTAASAEKNALAVAGNAGADQRHVWDMEPYTHGHFRFRNNENGYGLYRSGFDEGDSVSIHTTIIQWAVDTTGGGLYRIGYMYGHLEDRFLTVDTRSAGTPVRMRARKNSDAQLWYIKDYEDDPTQVYGRTTDTRNTGSPYLVRHGILFITPSGPGPVSVALFDLHGRKVASVIRNGSRNGTIQVDLRECVATTAVHIAQIEGAGGDRFVKFGLY